MSLYINPVYLTGSLECWPLEELAGMGYKGLELVPECLARLDLLKPEVEKAGLEMLSVNAMPDLRPYLTGSLNDAVEHRRRSAIDELLRVLETMNRERMRFLVVGAGRVAENYQSWDQARELLAASLRELGSAAGDVTVLLGLVPRRMLRSCGEVAALVDEVDSPRVAAALDIGHSLLIGEDPVDARQILGDRMKYVQLHDIDLSPGVPRLDRHLTMGRGDVKRDDVQALIVDIPAAVNIAAPDDPITAAKDALDWVQG
jgi:sugar phosphate isomerase/epimerase